jgi:hypothetical protein
MPALNDTLTVSLVLILLFGAVSLYLYTRIQQCEQKLNLVESILLDIKMSAELRDYPDLPMQSAPAPVHIPVAPVRPPSPTTAPTMAPQQVIPFEDVEYADGLPTIDETREMISSAPVALAPASPAPAPAPSSRASVGANYESMTLSELKALAQQRNITGAKSMKRNQILEALRTSDRAAEASPVLGSSESLAPNASDVEGFTPLEGTTLTEIHA